MPRSAVGVGLCMPHLFKLAWHNRMGSEPKNGNHVVSESVHKSQLEFQQWMRGHVYMSPGPGGRRGRSHGQSHWLSEHPVARSRSRFPLSPNTGRVWRHHSAWHTLCCTQSAACPVPGSTAGLPSLPVRPPAADSESQRQAILKGLALSRGSVLVVTHHFHV